MTCLKLSFISLKYNKHVFNLNTSYTSPILKVMVDTISLELLSPLFTVKPDQKFYWFFFITILVWNLSVEWKKSTQEQHKNYTIS